MVPFGSKQEPDSNISTIILEHVIETNRDHLPRLAFAYHSTPIRLPGLRIRRHHRDKGSTCITARNI